MPYGCRIPRGSGDFDGDGLIELVFFCDQPGHVYIAEVSTSGQFGIFQELVTTGLAYVPFEIAR
jgi:hypothetical protein